MEIEARDIAVRYGRTHVLENVDFSLRPGEMVGLIGPNGSGKTSLLRILANLRAPDAGTIRYGGKSAAQIGRQGLARHVSYLAQGGAVHWSMRVEALVALGRLPYRRPMAALAAADQAAIERAMEACDVTQFRHRTMSEVSGGERLRILLARALAVEANVLLADEPIAALDPLHQLQVMELLHAIARAGRGVIVVLHDLALAARYCDRLTLLGGGGVVVEGTPGKVLSDEYIANAYGVKVARGEHGGIPYLLPWAPLSEGTRPTTK